MMASKAIGARAKQEFFSGQTVLLMAENNNVYQMITTFHVVV